MVVFRIENDKKKGPYHGDCGVMIGGTYDTHPTPDVDGIDIAKEDVCGFDSLDKLLDWFGHVLPQLEARGFRTCVYRVKKKFVKRGKRQVCFVKHRARFVGVI